LRTSDQPRTVQPADLGIGRLFWAIPEAVIAADVDTGTIVLFNPAAERMFGYAPSEVLGQPIEVLIPPALQAGHRAGIARYRESGRGPWVDTGRMLELPARRRDGDDITVELSLSRVNDTQLAGQYVLAVIRDVTQRRQIADALHTREAQLAEAQRLAHLGSWEWDLDRDRLTWSDELYRIYALDPETELTYAAYQARIHPEDREHVQRVVQQAREYGTAFHHEHRVVHPDGALHFVEGRGEVERDEQGRVVRMHGTALDITERKEIQRLLEVRAAELARSNADLEQFAYVASHDLQEPLRAVVSYLQLLEKRYKGQLDERADKYINYAVDGARRMQTLIGDLLAYSRVGRSAAQLVETDTQASLAAAVARLRSALDENGGCVTHDPLPTLAVEPGQLEQLFQNLIGNALKFRGVQPPRIHVSAERGADEWVFRVQDNGIGIEAAYHQRVFILFQRLHTRAEYPGTGIGLAICKRIVERRGGRIWVESELGQGATFCFSVPDELPHG
jgi:PAS domain S-box-containing protein